MEDKVTERKLVKMILKTFFFFFFSHIQGYIYPHIVAVMSLNMYLVFVGHSLQCLSKTTTILHQSISSVKVTLGEKIVFMSWKKFVMNSFLFFYKKYVLHTIFHLIQESPLIWAYSGKISL